MVVLRVDSRRCRTCAQHRGGGSPLLVHHSFSLSLHNHAGSYDSCLVSARGLDPYPVGLHHTVRSSR